MKLKYLFIAEYKDGTKFEQNAEDASLVEPLKSAFFDLKAEDTKRFMLVDMHSDPQYRDTYLVDLSDGHFEINGQEFLMHDGAITDYRLIYFRRVQRDYCVGVEQGNFKDNGKEVGCRVAYHFGWQGKDEKGNNVQRVMVIK